MNRLNIRIIEVGGKSRRGLPPQFKVHTAIPSPIEWESGELESLDVREGEAPISGREDRLTG